MIDFLLPRTDAGVAAQAIGLAMVGPAGIVLAWRNRELRIFAIGLVVAAAAWMALRTVH